MYGDPEMRCFMGEAGRERVTSSASIRKSMPSNSYSETINTPLPGQRLLRDEQVAAVILTLIRLEEFSNRASIL